MTPFLQLALTLAILIAAAKAGGLISVRLGQPSVLGELIIGILLGPTLVDVLHLSFITDEHLPEVIHELAEIGVILLMFLAGLELHISDLAKSGKSSALIGSLGVFFPLILGVGLTLIFPLPLDEAIFLGLILSATSVSISAQTLMELQVLRSRVGISLLGAAVFDDILVVLGLSIFSAMVISSGTGGISQVLLVIAEMTAFLLVAFGLGYWLIPRLTRKIIDLPISQGLISFTIITILLYGWAAEVFGNMAAITGAFLAGLLFARSTLRDRIESGISTLAYGIFVPIFFISVGLQADIRKLFGAVFWLFLVMSILAILGKILGAGLGSLLSGFSKRESLQIGIGMMSRGEVGLIVASVGITQGIIDQSIFSAVVGVVILTTILTPPLLRLSFKNNSASPPKSKSVRKDTKASQLPHEEGAEL